MTVIEVQEQMQCEGIPYPSMIVNSGHGIHCYWVLNKRAGKEIEPVLKTLSDKLSSDSSTSEVARVMRFPGSLNVKDTDHIVSCELLEVNNNTYTLDEFINLLDVQEDKPPKMQIAIEGLAHCRMACIRTMSAGVSKGERNFALGKITAWLKQQGYTENNAYNLVQKWNNLNVPPKPQKELEIEFRGFWDGNYKYLGCNFSDNRLNTLNKSFCDEQCPKQGYYHDGEGLTAVPNGWFKKKVYSKIPPLELAIISTVDVAGQITREKLANYLNYNPKSPTFIKALQSLKQEKVIKIDSASTKRRNGIPDTITLLPLARYAGYTMINHFLTKDFKNKELSGPEFKTMILLEHFSYGKNEVFPTVATLAEIMGITERRMTQILASLEDKLLIDRIYKTYQGKTKLFIKLKLHKAAWGASYIAEHG